MELDVLFTLFGLYFFDTFSHIYNNINPLSTNWSGIDTDFILLQSNPLALIPPPVSKFSLFPSCCVLLAELTDGRWEIFNDYLCSKQQKTRKEVQGTVSPTLPFQLTIAYSFSWEEWNAKHIFFKMAAKLRGKRKSIATMQAKVLVFATFPNLLNSYLPLSLSQKKVACIIVNMEFLKEKKKLF